MKSQPPDARPSQNLRLVRHHAEDRVRLAVEAEALADDAGIGTEARPPERFRQHDGVDSLGIVGGEKRAADERLHTERFEYSRRHPLAGHGLRALRGGHDHAAGARKTPPIASIDWLRCMPIAEIERRDETLGRCFRLLPDRHQAIRIR